MEKKSNRLDGKRIALCITGSIAAIESPKLARELRRHGAEVWAFMTSGALDIIGQNAMEFASSKQVITKITGKVEHLQEFDVVLVAPATANIIGKVANGIADSAVTTLILSTNARVIFAPSMHLTMYKNKMFRENLDKLTRAGYGVIEPLIEEKTAKMAPIEDIVERVVYELYKKDLEGRKVVITAGPTIEYIDPIRIITNKSSGKMGVALAKEAYFRGADVKLIYGRGTEKVPTYLDVEEVETGEEMLEASLRSLPCDIFISAAAVSDFTLKASDEKLDSTKEITLRLVPAPKVLERIKNYGGVKVGFKALYKADKDKILEAAYGIKEKYGLSLVVANDVSRDILGAYETEAYLISNSGVEYFPRASKFELAAKIFDILSGIL
jgi:phosphopantothenoylcysteine decarboxylase/phosphopantothenate--cysteine ligase